MCRIAFILSSFLLLSLPAPSRAGWGPGGCGPVGSPVTASAEQGYRWVQSTKDADSWALLLNGAQIGAARKSNGGYWPLANGTWGDRATPPAALPFAAAKSEPKRDYCKCCGEDCKCASGKHCGKPNCPCVLPGAVAESDGTLNFGLVRPEIGRKPRRVHNGNEVDRETLLSVLDKASIPDDSGMLAVTVIGNDAERQRVLSDLRPLAASKNIKIKAYDPTDWAVADSGFVTTGHPTIYCQAPNGKVLHRQDSYAGPEQLAQAVAKAEDLRDKNPTYNPALDPNLNSVLSGGLSLDSVAKWLETVPAWAWLLLAFLLYLRFGHKESAK